MTTDDCELLDSSPSAAPTRLGRCSVLLRRLLHDLKQPLNVIRVVAQDVRLDVDRDRLELDTVSGSMKEIEGATGELVRMLDRLRCLVASPVEPSVTTGAEAAAACEVAVSRLGAASEYVTFSHPTAESLPTTTTDLAGLEHAVWELLRNALEAGDTGAGSVALSIAARDGALVISVADRGTGIPETEHRRVFEPFFSTRDEAGGLGLPLARALLESSDGRVELARSDEGGSVFEIQLPVQSVS